ncbi:MAG: Redox-active disulfide protein 2 [Acetothermia bacterium 64_32]|nr:MAG: Redox-active disulfide protein 2 [Acetothermia bacterium 64_32]HAF70639.1 thioredoxin family protein [Candidatus Acetothermia bacterium]
MKIEVLGTGCPKCQATIRNAEQAVRELSIQAEIAKVDDLAEIAARGVMVTPALAIDGEIKCSGRIPTVEEIKSWLKEDP